VSVHAIVGLVGFNLLLLIAGSGALWGVRGWEAWSELARLAGLAYLLGVACVGVLLVNELVLGIPFAFATVVLTALIVFLAGVALGRALGRTLPPLRNPARERVRGPLLISAVGAGLVTVYLEALFRSGRLAGLSEWDSMAFWVPKAKAIYFFGGLDEAFFRTLAGPSYPPLIPSLEAASFEFMGSTDTVTLHLLFWFLFAGFIAAIAGLLAPRVPPLLLWPAVGLVLLAPRVYERVLDPQADFLLDYFWALAVLLIALWLLERRPWQIVLATLFLGAAMLTKREGYLLTACAIVAALLASRGEWRSVWPRLAIVGGCAVALTAPWRIWFESRHLPGEGAEAGGLGLLSHLDRLPSSTGLALESFFDPKRWLLVAPAVIIALCTAWLAGRRKLALYATLVYVLVLAGFVWIVWSFPSMPITTKESVNPIVRVTGSLIVVSAALVPLLLGAAWQKGERPVKAVARAPHSYRLAWTVFAVAALAYPLVALAGGGPHFPSRQDCAVPATNDGKIDLVLGTFGSMTRAMPLLEQARELGFVQVKAGLNGCGEVEVAVHGYPTLAGAKDAIGEARRAGLRPRLEQG
jgi:hypothetical protein